MHAIIDPVSGLPRALTVLEKSDVRAGIAAAHDADLDAVALSTAEHSSRQDNPHNVNAADVGLGNVNNTADVDKPVSTIQAQAIAAAVTAHALATTAGTMTYAQRCALMGISTSTSAPDPTMCRWYSDASGGIHYSNGTTWSTI